MKSAVQGSSLGLGVRRLAAAWTRASLDLAVETQLVKAWEKTDRLPLLDSRGSLDLRRRKSRDRKGAVVGPASVRDKRWDSKVDEFIPDRLLAAFTRASLLAPKQASANEGGGQPPHSINRLIQAPVRAQ